MKRRNFIKFGSLALLALLPMGLAFRALAETSPKKDPAQGYDSLPADQKSLVQKNWERFKAFTPEKQQELKATFAEMKKLPPDKLKKIQENYQHWKTLSPGEQADVKRKYATWSTLDEVEKQKLRGRLEKFKALSEQDKANVLESLKQPSNAQKGELAK